MELDKGYASPSRSQDVLGTCATYDRIVKAAAHFVAENCTVWAASVPVMQEA